MMVEFTHNHCAFLYIWGLLRSRVKVGRMTRVTAQLETETTGTASATDVQVWLPNSIQLEH
jgi:hypothetical protein